MDDVRDDAEPKDALQGAVERVLKEAIAFRPTVVVLTHAVLVRGRLYVRLLLADQEARGLARG